MAATSDSYPEFSAATRETLALHAFLRGLQPESLGQHVRLTEPQTLDAALDQAERAEEELCRRASVDAAGAAAAPGTKNVERKGRGWTATLPATKTAEASPAGVAVGRPNVGGRRRMGCPNGAPEAPYSRTWWGPRKRWSLTTPPGPLRTVGDERPNPRGRLYRNGAATGRGQGGGAGPLNNRDCAVGVGVVGTSDP
ncbi:unnamed protein product [Boreogadus saida]